MKNGREDFDLATEDETEDVVKESHLFAYKGNTFHASYWHPANTQRNQVKAIIFLCHGYGEYLSFVWEQLARELAVDCEALVFGHDHVGHGRTTGPRVQVESMDDYSDPLLAHVDFVRAHIFRQQAPPTYLFAHSLGNLMSLSAIFKRPELFKGYAACGPLMMIDPDLATPLLRFMARALSGIMPNFALQKLDPNHVTRDPEVVRKIEADPLIWSGGFKARHSWVVIQACEFAQNNLPNLKLPILVLQGGKDKLVVPDGARMLVDNASSEDKEFVEYPDAFHNLCVETEEVRRDALDKFKAFFKRLIAKEGEKEEKEEQIAASKEEGDEDEEQKTAASKEDADEEEEEKPAPKL